MCKISLFTLFLTRPVVKKNIEIFKHIKSEAILETEQLATERGECPDMEGTGRRNSACAHQHRLHDDQ